MPKVKLAESYNCLYYQLQIIPIIFPTIFILTHPVNVPRVKKPENSGKTHYFLQSIDDSSHLRSDAR